MIRRAQFSKAIMLKSLVTSKIHFRKSFQITSGPARSQITQIQFTEIHNGKKKGEI